MSLADLPSPFSRAEAFATGLSRRAVDEALFLDQIRRVTRDVYALNAPPDPDSEDWEKTAAAHVQRLREALRRFPGHVASHTSAALLHGLPVLISPDSPVEVTAVERCPRSRQQDGLVIHHSKTTSIPVREVEGLRVTSSLRTVADTLRTRRLPHATALVDHVLRTGLHSRKDLLTVLAEQKRWRGRPRAMLAIELSDPRRETWLESYSDVRLLEHGVPLPLPQVKIFDLLGRFVARVDGLDEQHGIFREADGQAKYFLGMASGAAAEESARAALAAEEVRHRQLESLGLRGVRWGSSEILETPQAVARRVKVARQQPVPAIQAYAEWEGELRVLPFSVERPGIDLEKGSVRRPRRRAS